MDYVPASPESWIYVVFPYVPGSPESWIYSVPGPGNCCTAKGQLPIKNCPIRPTDEEVRVM